MSYGLRCWLREIEPTPTAPDGTLGWRRYEVRRDWRARVGCWLLNSGSRLAWKARHPVHWWKHGRRMERLARRYERGEGDE